MQRGKCKCKHICSFISNVFSLPLSEHCFRLRFWNQVGLLGNSVMFSFNHKGKYSTLPKLTLLNNAQLHNKTYFFIY